MADSSLPVSDEMVLTASSSKILSTSTQFSTSSRKVHESSLPSVDGVSGNNGRLMVSIFQFLQEGKKLLFRSDLVFHNLHNICLVYIFFVNVFGNFCLFLNSHQVHLNFVEKLIRITGRNCLIFNKDLLSATPQSIYLLRLNEFFCNTYGSYGFRELINYNFRRLFCIKKPIETEKKNVLFSYGYSSLLFFFICSTFFFLFIFDNLAPRFNRKYGIRSCIRIRMTTTTTLAVLSHTI